MKNSAAHSEQEYKEFLRLRAEDPAHRAFVRCAIDAGEKILERKLTPEEIAPLHNMSYMMLESLAMNWPHCTVEEVSNDVSHIKSPTEPIVRPVGTYGSLKQKLDAFGPVVDNRPLWKRIFGIK